MEVTLSKVDQDLLNLARYGRNYGATRNSRMFVAANASAGIAILAAHATNGNPTLWNPLGSGRVVSIKKLRLAYVSGTNLAGSFAWNITENTGADIGPATAAILTATRVAVRSAYAGGGLDSKAIWVPSATASASPTFTAAPTYHRPIGLSLLTAASGTAAVPYELGEDYDGDNLIMPGTALTLCTVSSTTTSLFRVIILFEEIDL